MVRLRSYLGNSRKFYNVASAQAEGEKQFIEEDKRWEHSMFPPLMPCSTIGLT